MNLRSSITLFGIVLSALAVRSPVFAAETDDTDCTTATGIERSLCDMRSQYNAQGQEPPSCAVGSARTNTDRRYCRLIDTRGRDQRRTQEGLLRNIPKDQQEVSPLPAAPETDIPTDTEEEAETAVPESTPSIPPTCEKSTGVERAYCNSLQQLADANESIPSCAAGVYRSRNQQQHCMIRQQMDRDQKRSEKQEPGRRIQRTRQTEIIDAGNTFKNEATEQQENLRKDWYKRTPPSFNGTARFQRVTRVRREKK